MSQNESPDHLRVGLRVRVLAGPHTDDLGVIVEDFGDSVGVPVQIGAVHIVDAARRWAVALDDGTLVFLDNADLTPAPPP